MKKRKSGKPHKIYGSLAQQVEQQTFNLSVPGSSPGRLTILYS